MAKYNKKATPVAATVVTTHQGGTGFQLKPELELMSLLANGINNTFYEKETEQDKRLNYLIQEVAKKDAELVAKMLVYTRSVIGQRSVTHRGAVSLMPVISGREIAKFLFTKRSRKENAGGLIYRLDDMLEIAACYFALNSGKRLPNAMVKGFKQVLENSDAYELAKYQGKDKSVSLVDLVNLVHPKPSEKMMETFKSLMNGELKQFNTVEDKNTKAGQEIAAKVKEGEISQAEAEVELKKAKEATFKELVDEKTIGYLALLRNLRNILNNTNDAQLIKDTCAALTDEKAIKKSLVFPHQIDLALEILLNELGTKATPFVKALNEAYEKAIPNLSELGATGRTAVIFDESGSMTSGRTQIGNIRISPAIEKAALIAATLAKGLNADVYSFDTKFRARSFNPNDSVNTIKNSFIKADGGGTYFNIIFEKLPQRYDRVFIISDMQGADAVGGTLSGYKSKFGVDPYVYCINLCGYANSMVNPNNKKVFQLFGYSSEVYEIVKKQEIDYNALLNEVKKINIVPKGKTSLKKDLAS